jgi:hypothetical protein
MDICVIPAQAVFMALRRPGTGKPQKNEKHCHRHG